MSGFGDFGGMSADDIINIFAGRHGFGGFSGFGNPFGGGGFRQQREVVEPGDDKVFNMTLTIEDIFNGTTKDLEYEVNIRCGHCNGQGGSGIETCSHCHGTGMITETQRRGPGMIFQSSHPCQYCGGTGKTVKEKCKECNGTGFKKSKRKETITVPAGVVEGQAMRISGGGCEAKNPRGQTGDLIIQFVYKLDKQKYAIMNNGRGSVVYEKVDIPYYDCILGAEKEITLPNNKKVKYKVKENTMPNDQITLRGEGINGNDYILIVNMTYVDHSFKKSVKELSYLKDIQKLHK